MNRRRTLLWRRGLMVAALALPLMLPPFASRGRAAENAPDRIFVIVPDSVRPLTITADSLGDKWTGYDCLDSLNRQHNWQNIYKSFPHPSHDGDGIYTVVLLDTLDMDTVVADYLDGGCLDNAYKMLSIEPFFVAPDDPLYLNGGSDSSQWGLNEWYSRVNQVWEITKGREDLVIAIVDVSFFWDHEELEGSVWINAGEDANGDGTFQPWSSDSTVPGDLNGVDDDGNGYVDDVVGMKWTNGEQRPDVRSFRSAHGVFVSSVAGGRTNNGEGLAGVAGGWGTTNGPRLMASIFGTDNFDDIYNAVEYAVNAGADIINMSWGINRTGPRAWEYEQFLALETLIERAYSDSNIICVAAAGNSGDTEIHFPAAFGNAPLFENDPAFSADSRLVVGVGSLDRDSLKCDNSTYGGQVYDVAAPGWAWGLWVQGSIDDYSYSYNWSANQCATSWAAPHVSGVLALIWSAFPEKTNTEIIQLLFNAANRILPFPDRKFRYGNVDAFEAIVDWPESPWAGMVSLYGDVVIPPGDSIIVDPGTQVLLNQDFTQGGVDPVNVEIIVNGTLIVRGSAADPVVFQPDTAGGVTSWHGIRVGDGGRVIFDTVTIRNAYCGIEFENTGICSVNATLIEDCEMYGIYTESDSLVISGCKIQNIPNGYGVRSVNADLDMISDTIYRCDYGVSQEGGFWGGTIECCQFGEDNDTNGTRGLYIEGHPLVKQCEFDGFYFDPTIMVDGFASPTIYSCYLDGDMASGTGIYADNRASGIVRSTRVRFYVNYGIHCYKAGGFNLGDAPFTDGNNSISRDTTSAKVIWAELCSVTAENNYYYTVIPKSGLFKGSVDWDPYLTAFPDSIPDSDCDGIDPPDSHHNKIVIVDQAPSRLELGQNYPNPFNPSTVVRYSLDHIAHVRITIYNVLGQRVRGLVDDIQAGGPHEAIWDGRDGRGRPLASGVYLYRLEVNDQVQTKKMVLLR